MAQVHEGTVTQQDRPEQQGSKGYFDARTPSQNDGDWRPSEGLALLDAEAANATAPEHRSTSTWAVVHSTLESPWQICEEWQTPGACYSHACHLRMWYRSVVADSSSS